MIPLSRPSLDSTELKEIEKVFDSRWIAGGGPKNSEFSQSISAYVGARYAIPVNSCTAALHLSLLSMGIGPGDDVLVSDYTFPSTAFAVMYCGARPIFVDVDPDTFNMSPADFKRKISKRSKAVIPVHAFGQTVEMDPVLETAKKKNLRVIEDAACAFGAEYKKRKAGTLGDAGCFSFHARKNATTGEGGAVVTNDKKIAHLVQTLSNVGIASAYERSRKRFQITTFSRVGYNYRLSDINAAVGIAQVRKNKAFIQERRRLARYYNKLLESVDFVLPPVESGDCLHIYQSYVATLDRDVDMARLINAMKSDGVQCRPGTYACHIQPAFKSKSSCPVSEDIARRAVALPMFNGLTKENIETVVSVLGKNIRKARVR